MSADVGDTANHPVVVATVGAFVSLILARKMSLLQALIAWVGGFSCAMYLAPPIIGYYGIEKYGPGVIFSVGAFGLQIIAIAYELIEVVRENPSASWRLLLESLLRRGQK